MVPFGEADDPFAHLLDDRGALVAEDDRKRVSVHAPDGVPIRSADPGGRHPDPHLPRLGRVQLELLDPKRRAELEQDCRAHAGSLPRPGSTRFPGRPGREAPASRYAHGMANRSSSSKGTVDKLGDLVSDLAQRAPAVGKAVADQAPKIARTVSKKAPEAARKLASKAPPRVGKAIRAAGDTVSRRAPQVGKAIKDNAPRMAEKVASAAKRQSSKVRGKTTAKGASAAKSTTAKKSTAKKSAAKRPAAKKSTAKRSTPKKTS